MHVPPWCCLHWSQTFKYTITCSFLNLYTCNDFECQVLLWQSFCNPSFGVFKEVKHSSDILMSKTLQALYRCFPVLLSFNVCLSLSLFGSPFSLFIFLFFVVVYYINTFLLLTIYLHGNRNCLLIFVSLCLFNSLCGVCCRQGHCSALNIIAVPYRCNLISTVICLSLHHPACRICPDKSHHFL